MKELTLLGATGFVGTAIKNEALSRGYKVNAISRGASNSIEHNPNLNNIQADVMNESELTEILKGTKNLISAYNPGWRNPNMYEEQLVAYPKILSAAKMAGIGRILITGGAATLFVKPGVTVLDTGALPDAIMGGVKSLAEFYYNNLKNEKEIDWVFFSPAGHLNPGEKTNNYRLGKDDLIVDANGESNISVGDYAKAMIDELEQENHHFERFTIGY